MRALRRALRRALWDGGSSCAYGTDAGPSGLAAALALAVLAGGLAALLLWTAPRGGA